ncbi:MAG: hypothetical protein ACXABU_08215, partial [Candidatus Hodarchaeales archaeon]
GPINVTLTFQIDNYNAAIFHINVTSIESTSLTVNDTNIVLTWRENVTLQIWYNNSANIPIPGATIIVDGDTVHPAIFNSSSGAYYYRLNSTQYSGTGTYLNLNITADRTYYQTQAVYFDLTINPADSSIDNASINPVNYPLAVTNGSMLYFWVIWLSEYGDPLNDSNGVGISSTDVILSSTDATTGNHTFEFVPTTIGPINVTLTFQIDNYNAAIFHINVTSIESTSLTVNETNIVLTWRENTSLEIWYNNSVDVPIPSATIIVDGDTAHPAVYDSSSGAYHYKLNSTHYSSVGTYLNLNITASRAYYQNQTLLFDLTINPADTSINDASVNPGDYPLEVTNGSTFYFWVIWFSEYGDPLNDSNGVGISSTNVILSSTEITTGNHTFKFIPTTNGPINVTLTFQINNYNAATFNINVTSIESTSFTVNETNIVLNWRANTTLELWYNNSFSSPIVGATIIIDGDTSHPAVFNSSSGVYYYRFNSTRYNGVGSYLNLNITAQRTYYRNQTLFFDLSINPADSYVDDASVNPVNYPLEVTNGSTFYFWVIWFSEYGDPLNDSNGIGTSNSDVIMDSTDPVTGNHTFKFIPTTIGPMNVTLTLQIDNYNAAIFHINVTSVESTSLSVNETNIVIIWRENVTLQIWYNNSANTPIPSATIIVDGDFSHPAFFNSSSGAYYYQFNSTRYNGIGSYLNLNISAHRTYYQTQTLYFDLTINPADSFIDDTSVNPVDYPLEVTNGSTFYFWVIWFSEYGDPLNDSNGVGISNLDVVLDSTNPAIGNHTFKFVPTTIGPINVTLTFQVDNYDAATFNINVTSIESTSLTVNETNIVLTWRGNTTLEIWYNNSANIPILGATIIVQGDTSHTAVFNSSSGTYNYKLNSTHYSGVGTYLNLNVTASRTYHQNQTFYFDLTIIPADTSINEASVNPVDYPLEVTNGSAFYFWVIWFSEYGDPLNDSNGVGISDLNVVLDYTDPVSGNHTFKFVPTTIGPINVTLTFQINNYNSIIFHINITSIESTSFTANETSLVLAWRENTTLQIWYNDSVNVPVPGATIIVEGDTSHPAIFNSSTSAYYYKLNSTQYGGVGSYLNLNITAFRTYYQNQTLFFDLAINAADSSIDDASVNPVEYPLEITNGSIFYFWVIWFSEYGDPLNDSDGVEISSTDVVLDSTNPATGNHTFKFVPTTIGPINVSLTFEINNYNAAIFNINVTSIESTSLTVNGTVLVLNWRENTTLQIWYNNSVSNPIPSAIIIVDGDISHPAVFNSSSGAYYYQLNTTQYSGVGNYLNLDITASRVYFQNQTFFFDLIINPADSSIENTSLKLYPEINDIPSDEIFEFWLIWQSEFKDSLNASNGVLINGTLNNHPDMYFSDTNANIGNHSFTFFYSGTSTLTYNLTFSIENYKNLEFQIRFNIYNRTMMIDNGLSNPENGQTFDFLQSGEIYYFNVFINDSSTKQPLNTTLQILPENVIFIGYTAEGNHSFLYNASVIGIFSELVIVFTLQNYNSLNYNISFTVSPREIILDSSRSTSQSIDYLQYGDIFYLQIYFNDSRTGVHLNISIFELPSNFYFENFSITKGHLFLYQALEIGDFLFKINFTKQNYNIYTHTLVFNITKANSELIPSTTSVTTYYSNDSEFSLVWQSIPNPNISSSPILSISNTSDIIIQPTSPEWINNINLLNIENGSYLFSVVSNRVGSITITIHFYSDNYTPIFIDILINIIPMPTFEPQISFPSELIIGEALVISSNQWVSIYNESVRVDDFQLFNDTLPIDFTLVNSTEYSFAISIDTEDLRQGFHNLTLKISTYGYENHSLNVFMELIGREIEISIEIYPKTLVQGSDFTVTATLTYASLQKNLGGFGSELLLVPLEGVSVNFLVQIKYSNGSTRPLEYENTTNEFGEAKFTVAGIYTLSAEGIDSIVVTSGVTASGKESTQSTHSNFFDTHRFDKKVTENPDDLIFLGILIFILSIGILSPIGYYRIRKRKKGQEIIKETGEKNLLEPASQDTPEVTPDLIPPLKEIADTKVQTQAEIKAETEKRKKLIKKTEEKIIKSDKLQTKPVSWITEFPPTVSECEKEIRFLFNLILNRKGQWHGKTTYNYLVKQKTVDISATNLRKVYMILPQQTSYFTKEKTSLIITEEGKRIALIILNSNEL